MQGWFQVLDASLEQRCREIRLHLSPLSVHEHPLSVRGLFWRVLRLQSVDFRAFACWPDDCVVFCVATLDFIDASAFTARGSA